MGPPLATTEDPVSTNGGQQPLYASPPEADLLTSLPEGSGPAKAKAPNNKTSSGKNTDEASSVASTADKPRSTKATLYAKLGGQAAVSAAVDIFYKKLLADDYLKPFFENVDMVTLVAKQNRFLAFAFGATTHYSGKDIVMGHAHLIVNKGLNQSHFDAVAGHFVDTLKELNVAQDLVDEAAAVLMGVRPLFDPARYQGNIDIEKIEKSAACPASKASGQTPSNNACGPECCTIM